MKTLKTLLRSGLFLATFLTFAGIAHATDYTVTTLDDTAGDGTCDVTECTLREAIDDASTDGAGPNQVLFDATLSGGTFTLTGLGAINIVSNPAEFTIFANNDITIDGGGGNPGILGITTNTGNITIDGLNFRNGQIALSSGDTSTVTMQNCTFDYDAHDLTTRQSTINAGGNVTIQDNTFNNTNQAIDAASGVTIQGNKFADSYGDIAISVTGESDVLNNSIYINNEYAEAAWGAITLTSDEGTINVTGNEILSEDTDSEDKPTIGIFIRELTNTATFNISDNIIIPRSSSKKMGECIYSEGGSNITIENNICNFDWHAIYFSGNNSTVSNVLINHNTFFRGWDGGNDGDGISFNDMNPGTLTTSNITITNNIISALNSEVELEQAIADRTGRATITNDYNLIYNARANTGVTLGSNLIENYPAFIDYEDFELAPFSAAIGTASDGSDLGAVDYDGTRRTTIYVDAEVEIDFETVDFNTIQEAIDSAIDGDTVLVAAGTYDAPIEIELKTITLTGADKATTIIDATGIDVAFRITSSNASTISGFTIQNAGGERTAEYTLHSFDYNGHTYNAVPSLGSAEGYYIAGHKSSPADPDVDLRPVTEGETSMTVENTPNTHLALTTISEAYVAIYFLDDDFPDQATATEWLLELDASATIDYWKDDAFTYNETTDDYTFASSILGADTGVTLTNGSADPRINLPTVGIGLVIEDSSNNAVSDMNISNGQIGVYFTGDSLTNIILNAIFSDNGICSIYSDATGDNTVNGVTISEELCEGGEEVGDTTSPVGLTALTSSARTTSSVTLNWSAVTEENFDHYEVWYGTDSSTVTARTASEWDTDNDVTLATISTTSTTITGLSSATQYYFKIWAIDVSSNEETVEALSVTTSSGGGGGGVITDNDEPEVIDTDDIDTDTDFTDTIQEILDDAEEDAINDAADDLTTLQDLIDSAEELTETETIEDLARIFDLPLTVITEDIIDTAREVLDNDGDADGDGISNIEETLRGQDPFRAEDADNDGIPDFADPNPIDPSDFETPQLIANPNDFVFGTDNEDPLTLTTGRLEMAIVSDQGLVLSGTAKPNEEITITTRASGNGSVIIKTKADKNGRFVIAGELEGLNLGENSILAIQAENSDGYKKSILAKTRLETIDQPEIAFTGGNVKAVSELDSKTVQGVIAGTLEMPKLWTDIVNEKVKEYIATTEYNKYFVEVVAAAKERALGANKMIVQGHAKPGSTVIIAFKSVTFSSVVIADKNGYFESEVPQELVEELAAKKTVTDDLHQFIAFSVDYKSNKVSPFVQGLFKIYK